MSKRSETIEVTPGSGNVFADLGYKQADLTLLKAKLAACIADTIAARKWSQRQAAEKLGIDQPKVSALLNGRLRDFSVDRLLRFIIVLGQTVEIAIRHSPRSNRLRPCVNPHATP
ncbi:MAG: helix-turn-helix domain-containing protein [Gammaproteobacteria bacterium]